MKRYTLLPLLLFILLLGACNTGNNQDAPALKIVPDECELRPLEKIAFSLTGTQLPGTISIDWQADRGSILKLADGVNAEYTAPNTSGQVTITAIVTTSKNSDVWKYTTTCIITEPPSPIPQESPTPETSTSGNTATQPPAPSTPIPTATGNVGKIVISEVMIKVCGGEDYTRYNQYVELYNTGDAPIDVKDLWIYSPSNEYRGRKLVAWSTRNPDFPLPGNLVLNSTVIPPHGVAVILAPQYGHGPRPYIFPYEFPQGTVILTIADGIRLGDPYYAMRAEPHHMDVVIIYKGNETTMSGLPISTYGTPRINSKYLRDVIDNGLDMLPLQPNECFSVERVNPLQPDQVGNWRTVLYGSPGSYIP